MADLLRIEQVNDQDVVDSRLIAQELGIEHRALMQTIKKYQDRLERKTHLTFEMDTVTNSVGAVNETKYCYLNEAQATLLMTLSRNTEKVLDCKERLTNAFIEAKKIIKEVVNQQVEKEKPALGLADYIELKQKLDSLKQDRITELLNYRFVSELESLNVNQRQLGTATMTEQKHYQPCNLRAYDLGYNVNAVSNGTALGRYVKKLVEPAFQDYQGQYYVWYYEVNQELDNAIHGYFKQDLKK